jgi:hypothetical protein
MFKLFKHRAIEEQLKQDAVKMAKQVKLLLLGKINTVKPRPIRHVNYGFFYGICHIKRLQIP